MIMGLVMFMDDLSLDRSNKLVIPLMMVMGTASIDQGPGQQPYPSPPSSSRGSEREYRRPSRNLFAARSPPEHQQQLEQEKDEDGDMEIEDEHESGSGSGSRSRGRGPGDAGGPGSAGESVKFSRNDAR
ncbi:hypothetical protein Moror_5587 [Moniliophthora roreri MCA 2997]|uniref:Uncharacterized protein n=1 Tax=Moniliophthora roreri (strain MCA 2997) TaxID=1381753 RepID=V2X5S9_MONRO|nr:hypothetical protein Moror_5587 [Moniliophthora roreri MCA 2997]